MGFLEVLGLLFVALKLLGAIAWSWWWVLAPFWITPVTLVVVVVIWIGSTSKRRIRR